MFSIETFNYCRSPSVGKTSLTKQIIKHFRHKIKIAYLKIDVVKAFEDIELRKEFNILTKKYIQGTSAQTMLVSW